jgi:outer membrane protein OmpA-like peptidoglycan-associated protein
MAQEVTTGNMLAALNKQGFVALYINFDTNKATIKTEEGKAKNRRVEIVKQ